MLAFLSAWTSRLHAQGYVSGVYSSAGSGITDLVARWGTGYLEPDDLWIAEWNGQATTRSAYVPGGEWSNHQRLKQYRGGHDERYRGVTINIDNDYLDGKTADAGRPPNPPPPTRKPPIRIFGKSAFVAAGSGFGGVPAGCYGWEPVAHSIVRSDSASS